MARADATALVDAVVGTADSMEDCGWGVDGCVTVVVWVEVMVEVGMGDLEMEP